MGTESNSVNDRAIEVELDGTFFGADAVLKACYWYARQFDFDLRQTSVGRTLVTLKPKDANLSTEGVRGEFIAMVTDFTLRERIESRTGAIREILLAKAFAEAGVLEDSPSGEFVDQVEHEQQDGLFKILPH